MKKFLLLLAFLALLPLAAKSQTVLWSRVGDSTFHGITCAKFVPGDSIILLGAYPNLIYQVDVLTGTLLFSAQINPSTSGEVRQIEITKDGKFAYIICNNGSTLCKYDIKNNVVIRSCEVAGAFCLTKNDSLLLFATNSLTNVPGMPALNLYAKDINTFNTICYNKGPYFYDLSDIDVAPDGKSIVVYAGGKTDYGSHPPQYTYSHIDIISMDYNDSIYFKTIKPLTYVEGNNKQCRGNIRYSPDGKHILAGFGRLLVYDVENQTEIFSDTSAWIDGSGPGRIGFIDDSTIFCLNDSGGYNTINIYNKSRHLYLDKIWIYLNICFSNNKMYIFSGDASMYSPLKMISNPLITEVGFNPANQSLIIYPNPVKDNLNLDNVNIDGKSTISLYDIQSRDMTKYLNSQMQNISQSTTLDVSKLPAGVYYLKIGDSRNFKTVKFVKE